MSFSYAGHFRLLKCVLILSVMLLCACRQDGGSATNASPSSSSATAPRDPQSPTNPDPEDPSTEEPTKEPPVAEYAFEPLVWETASRPVAKEWSQYVFSLLKGVAKPLLSASDFSLFCPTYQSLNENEKINVAGQLIAGIVKYESGFNPLNRFQESTMGTDPITGQPVWSEGLMQLSYQDTQWASYCKFDWSKDRLLSATDPDKTILDPETNLNCGVQILARQIQSKGKIVLASGAYWAVIKSNNANEKIDEIASIVSSLSVCQ